MPSPSGCLVKHIIAYIQPKVKQKEKEKLSPSRYFLEKPIHSMGKYDFTMEQEVLNEWTAGIWADYVSYCYSHGIDLDDMSQPMAAKPQLVGEYKRKIILTGECTAIEDLEPIEARLKELRDYLKEVEGEEEE